MAKHLKDHCPLTMITCEYSYAGCDVTLPRKEIPDHMDKAAKDHLQLVTKMLTKKEEDLKELSSIQTRLDVVQKELAQKDVDTKQEIARKDDQLALQAKAIDLLKQLCDLRDDEGVPGNQVLVSNFGTFETEHVIKSLFGQFGRIENTELYPWSYMAVVEFEDSLSVDLLFARYNTAGIKLRKVKLNCIRLS